MKSLTILSLKLLFCIFIITGCTNENKEVETTKSTLNSNLLLTDSKFKEFVNSSINLLENIKDPKRIEYLTQKENLSNLELDELGIAFGFKNFNDYSEFVKKQNKIITELNKDYKISNIERNKIEELVSRVGREIKDKELKKIKMDRCTELCKTEGNNCVIIATSVAVAAHLACSTLDVTVIVGALCHAAAYAGQVAQIDNCVISTGRCIDACNGQN